MGKDKENKPKQEKTDLSESIFSWPVTKKMARAIGGFSRNRRRFQLQPAGRRTKKAKR